MAFGTSEHCADVAVPLVRKGAMIDAVLAVYGVVVSLSIVANYCSTCLMFAHVIDSPGSYVHRFTFLVFHLHHAEGNPVLRLVVCAHYLAKEKTDTDPFCSVRTKWAHTFRPEEIERECATYSSGVWPRDAASLLIVSVGSLIMLILLTFLS